MMSVDKKFELIVWVEVEYSLSSNTFLMRDFPANNHNNYVCYINYSSLFI